MSKKDKTSNDFVSVVASPSSPGNPGELDLYAAIRHQFLEPREIFTSSKGTPPDKLVFSPVQEGELEAMINGD